MFSLSGYLPVNHLPNFIIIIFLVPSGFPQSFTEIVDSSRSIAFNWQAPPVSEQNGIIISYTINVTETRSSYGLQQMVHRSQTSITVTSLLPFTTYSCSIAASTSVGIGPFSTLLIATTFEDGMMYDYKVHRECIYLDCTVQDYSNTSLFLMYSPRRVSFKLDWVASRFHYRYSLLE